MWPSTLPVRSHGRKSCARQKDFSVLGTHVNSNKTEKRVPVSLLAACRDRKSCGRLNMSTARKRLRGGVPEALWPCSALAAARGATGRGFPLLRCSRLRLLGALRAMAELSRWQWAPRLCCSAPATTGFGVCGRLGLMAPCLVTEDDAGTWRDFAEQYQAGQASHSRDFSGLRTNAFV